MDSILNELNLECYSLEEIDAMLNELDPECCPLYDEDGKYMKSDSFLEQDDIDKLLGLTKNKGK